jgi:hypothetical protein
LVNFSVFYALGREILQGFFKKIQIKFSHTEDDLGVVAQ